MSEIEDTARRVIAEFGEQAYEQCRASVRFALGIESMEVALVMGATAGRVAQLQGLPPLESPNPRPK